MSLAKWKIKTDAKVFSLELQLARAEEPFWGCIKPVILDLSVPDLKDNISPCDAESLIIAEEASHGHKIKEVEHHADHKPSPLRWIFSLLLPGHWAILLHLSLAAKLPQTLHY
jgi:hypothetical protein